MNQDHLYEELKKLEPHEFIEIVQKIAQEHLQNDYTSAHELSAMHNETVTKQLLAITWTENF